MTDRVSLDQIGTPVTGYVRESYARERHPEEPELIELRRQGFDRWLAKHDAEVAASELERLAHAEKGMADWIGADIDGRGRTRLGEVAREYRSGKRICGKVRTDREGS